MSQSNLPDFSNTEPLEELRFHQRELYWDMTSLVKKMSALLGTFPQTSQTFQEVLSGMIDVTSDIEHDVTHHLAEALKLAGQILGKPSLLELGEQLGCQEINWETLATQLPNDGQIDDSARLHLELQELASNLRFSLDTVAQVANYQGEEATGWEQLEDKLKCLAEVLGTRSWLDAQKLYGQALRLNLEADPDRQARDDYWRMVSTPLNQNYHPSARSLDFCPTCGAILTSDDRTFDGSYCEECRTAWIESSEDSLLVE
ncbi:hypothetical protein [Nodularia sp. UHCC 0506]|uniref:hypothetical protein n=1 Tax=Nodularia sp. UHCC 0506 TaxID=3110243 RepID=UPI002B2082A4|nr:hypothetical protein [Nodularia sp. UHCC 0506]MEA5514775.1 hypothetical protein [Nodularia sp. UHCC 0506]